MPGRRTARVGHLIQMELSQIILGKLKDPRLGFVTVTHVDVTPDLKSARVFYSSLGNEEAKRGSQIALEKAAGFLQREIAVSLKLRYTPKLTFCFDDSFDKGFEIDRLLRNLDKEKDQQAS